MTQYSATRTAGPQPTSSSGGIDLKTLLITAVASATAAYVTSQIWAAGTLAAAAFTPVIVALVREALAKSTDVVVKAVPVKGVVRSTPPDSAPRPSTVAPPPSTVAAPPPSTVAAPPPSTVAAPPPSAGAAPPPSTFAPASGDWAAADLAAAQAASHDAAAARVPQAGEITYHSDRRARNWRVAIVTGLLGFLIAAVVFTVPELVAGGSATGGGRGTTIFGGKQRDSRTPAQTTTTTTVESRTVTVAPQQTVTVPPAKTVTTPPPTTTGPVPQQPVTTTPVPTTTTPPPAAEPPPPAEVPPG